jgi:hypothetical protein
MSVLKQPMLFGKNKAFLNACIMILETYKSEEDDFLFYSYHPNEESASLVKLKGIVLAASGISQTLLGGDYKMMLVKDKRSKLNETKYKVASLGFQKSFLLAVILPFISPDNVVVYVLKEFYNFLNLFFERFDECIKFTEIVNRYVDVLIFNVTNYILDSTKEDWIYSPLSNVPVMTQVFSYDENTPYFLIKPPLSDNLRTELIEIMNTLNSDRSVLQETLTLMDPPFNPRGSALVYNGFVIFNSLSNNELVSLYRLAMLHDMHVRSKSSSEVLSCEFLFETQEVENDEKKKILVTVLAQRDFVLLISLDIMGKNNCSFDPFYIKRAEDLLISLLKKSYSLIVTNELHSYSIRTYDDKQAEEKIFTDMESEIGFRKNSDNSFHSKTKDDRLNEANQNHILQKETKIKGFTDIETNVNIIHFAFYDDSESVVSTIDLNVSSDLLKEIYRSIYREYARIQSNINRIKNKSKQIRKARIFNYEESKLNFHTILKNEGVKDKMLKESFYNGIRSKCVKIDEYGYKLNVPDVSNMPVWICCKIYEHNTIKDEVNFDEYSNFKVIFVSYESHSPVDIDSFCQDLLINELFI